MNFTPYFSISDIHKESLSSLCFSHPKNENEPILLATSSNDKHISLFNIKSGEADKKWTYQYHLYGVNKIKFNADNSILASGGNDLSVNLVDLNKMCLLRNFRNESIVTCIDINSTSNLLIVGTYDNSIILYDIRSRNLIVKILSHSEPITSVTFSEDSTVIFSSSYDSFCRIWDVFKFNCLKTIVLENSPSLNSCSILPNENYVMLSSFNNQIDIIDIVTEEEVKKFGGYKHTNYLIDCGIYKNIKGKYCVLSGDEEGNLCSWDTKGDGNPIKYKVKPENENNMVVNTLDKVNDIVAVAGFNDKTNSVYLFKEIEIEKTKGEVDEDKMEICKENK